MLCFNKLLGEHNNKKHLKFFILWESTSRIPISDVNCDHVLITVHTIGNFVKISDYMYHIWFTKD